jgi:hypothetical protein
VVIQPTETSPGPETASQASSTPAPAEKTAVGKAFAAVHAEAVARDKTADSTNPVRERVPVPDGETWASTKPGAHYAQIITGPRTGQYINLTHGDRRGEAFTIEQRDGKKLHVYKESGTEVTIKPSVDASATTDAAKRAKHPPQDRPAKGERWAPVAGHNNYADILAGPRNGLYVNISGGVRDGMAFQIVKKGDKTFHVYGTGKDRQMIEVSGEKKAAAPANTTAGAAASGTGGTAAP